MGKLIVSILISFISLSCSGQKPDHYLFIDRNADRDSLFVLLSGNDPAKFDYGYGRWTAVRSLAAIIDSINGGGDNWGAQVVQKDFGLIGDGTTGNELEVDTSSLGLPTYHYVDSSLSTVGGSSSPSSIQPAQITADQDNYNPTGIGAASYVYLSSNDIRAITGIVDSVAGVIEKTLINKGDSTIYLPMDHPDSDAAHRFTGYGSDFKLGPSKSCKIIYDLVDNRWRVIGDDDGGTGVFYDWSPGSVTVGDWGQIGFTPLSSGTVTQLAASTTLPGASQLSTSTNIAGGFGLHYAKAVNDFSAFGSAHIFSECLISIPALSDGTETFTVELKITADPFPVALEDDNSVAIRYSHGINSGEWELYSQDNSSAESVADANIVVATATLYKLRIEVDKSNSEARAYINGAYVGRVNATMPNNVGCGAQVIIRKSAGNTARTLNVHSFKAGAIYQ